MCVCVCVCVFLSFCVCVCVCVKRTGKREGSSWGLVKDPHVHTSFSFSSSTLSSSLSLSRIRTMYGKTFVYQLHIVALQPENMQGRGREGGEKKTEVTISCR